MFKNTRTNKYTLRCETWVLEGISQLKKKYEKGRDKIALLLVCIIPCWRVHRDAMQRTMEQKEVLGGQVHGSCEKKEEATTCKSRDLKKQNARGESQHRATHIAFLFGIVNASLFPPQRSIVDFYLWLSVFFPAQASRLDLITSLSLHSWVFCSLS